MWRVTADEAVRCTECSHEIPPGAACLSQMPSAMPEGILRRAYDNFCLECEACDAEARAFGLLAPCYVRRLNRWYARKEKMREPVECGHCKEAIPAGSWAPVQKFYAWPDGEASAEPVDEQGYPGGAAAGAAAGVAVKPRPAGWRNLSRLTQRQFQRRGLGGARGTRSQAMARQLYERLVPEPVRNLGEPSVKTFVDGKDFSHIESVANAPGKAKAADNIVLESTRLNQARGSLNMTLAELRAASLANRFSELKALSTAILRGGVKAGLVSAAIEAAVAGPENFLHYKRGRKSGERAAKDAAKTAASASAVGVATAGAAHAAAMTGVGLSLSPSSAPIAVAGGAVFVAGAVYRIKKAAERDLPLDEYRVFFCKDTTCQQVYALSVVGAA